jgi:hypothetical protein
LNDGGLEILQDCLYRSLHCRSPGFQVPAVDPVASRELLRSLSDANCGRGPWQAGWIVRATWTGAVEADNYGLRWWIPTDLFRPPVPEIGTSGYVRVPKEEQNLFGGFYMILGDADDHPDGQLVRVYWNLSSDGAVSFVRTATSAINAARLPFRLKVLKEPSAYNRTDAAVMYIPRDSYQLTAPLLLEIRHAVKDHLRSPVSAYAKRLAPGIGLAENPGPGVSFGEHRSRALAKALASHEIVRLQPRARRLSALIRQLCDTGFDPEAAYLNAGSHDSYEPLGV